jgi:hypothetical protein
MHMATRRTLPLFLVAALLAMPWAVSAAGPQASPRPARAIQLGALDLFNQLWSFLRKGGCGIDPSGRCATKEGCTIDPSGKPACGPASAGGTKEGCGLDSGGKPACEGREKEGCHIDPNGCAFQKPRTQNKEGCRIDPDGRCLR